MFAHILPHTQVPNIKIIQFSSSQKETYRHTHIFLAITHRQIYEYKNFQFAMYSVAAENHIKSRTEAEKNIFQKTIGTILNRFFIMCSNVYINT